MEYLRLTAQELAEDLSQPSLIMPLESELEKKETSLEVPQAVLDAVAG